MNTYTDWLNSLSEKDWHEHMAGRLEYPYHIGKPYKPRRDHTLLISAIVVGVLLAIIVKYF